MTEREQRIKSVLQMSRAHSSDQGSHTQARRSRPDNLAASNMPVDNMPAGVSGAERFFAGVCALMARHMDGATEQERMRCSLTLYITITIELFPDTDIEDIKLKCMPLYAAHYDQATYDSWFRMVIADIPYICQNRTSETSD